MRKAILARGAVWALWALLLGAQPLPARSLPVKAVLLEDSAYSEMLVSRIRESKRRILCAFFLFKVGEKRGNLPAVIAGELVKASRRGVEVTVILEGKKPVRFDNHAAGRLLSQGGVRVIYPRQRRLTHAKAVVIDDRYLLMGSHNLTQSALKHNNELSVLLDSPELAASVSRYLKDIR